MPEIQRFVIEKELGFRVFGKQYLKAAIEGKTVYLVSADTPAGGVSGLDQTDAHSRRGELLRTGQAREASAYDDHVHWLRGLGIKQTHLAHPEEYTARIAYSEPPA